MISRYVNPILWHTPPIDTLACFLLLFFFLFLNYAFVAAEGTGPFPVEISPGPPTLGHRRMTRFVDTMKCSVWGFDTNEVRAELYILMNGTYRVGQLLVGH